MSILKIDFAAPLRLIVRVVQALKDAASDIRLHSALFLSMVGKLAWALPLLLVPKMFKILPGVYVGFEAEASEHVWAALLFALIALDVFAITRRTYGAQIAGLVAGGFTWFFFSRVITEYLPPQPLGIPTTPGGWLYLFAGIGCFVSLFRTAQKHHAEAEADNYLLLVHEVEQAQQRGEAWARARHQAPNAVPCRRASAAPCQEANAVPRNLTSPDLIAPAAGGGPPQAAR